MSSLFHEISIPFKIKSGYKTSKLNFNSPLVKFLYALEDGGIQNSDIKNGGIDFTGLPILTQKAIDNLVTDGASRIPREVQNRLALMDLDKKLDDMQKLLDGGMMPAANKIKECVQAAVLREDYDKYLDKLLSCISTSMRLEEEKCCMSNRIMKDLLVVLDSGMQSAQLKQIFTTPTS